MLPPASEKPTQRSGLEAYALVIHALMLRDMRTRFGGSHWGYAVVVMWPVAHIFLMVAIMVIRGIPSPMGNEPMLFIATGAVPLLVYQYISREVMKAVVMNRPLTYYPQVKIFDVMLARFIVEIIKSFTALIVVILILLALGIDPTPVDLPMAVAGYCMSILIGLGIGAINVAILSFFPGWMIGYVGFTILVYATSGVFFLPNVMPAEVYDAMKWNPMVQIIEWVRLGYNPAMGVTVDYAYVIFWGFGSLAVGLLLERTVVRRTAS
jgi:capsular polysaccharide transport system permease protein